MRESMGKESRHNLKESCLENQGQKSPKRLPWNWLLGVSLAALGGLAALALGSGWFSSGESSLAPHLKAEQWRVPIQGFQDGKARHFHHKLADGTTVRFFLLRASDGTLRAALDACEVCWPQGKGYVQDGNQMVCRNCGRRFASDNIGLYRGGCNPHPLPFRLEGNELSIRLQELREGARYFRLAGGQGA